jgi:L-iditol 2-dehydrogenase
VVEEVIRGCGECHHCQSGDKQLCVDARITGVHHDGAYAPYIVVPEEDLHAIPGDLPLRDAALVEPTAVAGRAVTHNSRVRAGSDVLVEGPGAIGILSALIARAQGGDVVVSGVGQDADYRLPLAEELGFDTVDVTETDLAGVAAERTGGRGFDVVVDTTGSEAALQSATEVVGKGGQIVVVGLTGEATLTFPSLVRGEVDVQCSYCYGWEDFETAIDLVRTGTVPAGTIADERFDLREGSEAYEAALAGQTTKPVFDLDDLR